MATTQRTRVAIACRNCRRRKIRCNTSEDPPVNPCQRCRAKGLNCEYIEVALDASPPAPVEASRQRPIGSGEMPIPMQYWPDGSPALQPVQWTDNQRRPYSPSPPAAPRPSSNLPGAHWANAAPALRPFQDIPGSSSDWRPPLSRRRGNSELPRPSGPFSMQDRYLPPPAAMLIERQLEAQAARNGQDPRTHRPSPRLPPPATRESFESPQ
ncbi:hypothetical protein C8F01DRAFT_502492 [Mycena amicta]|nr:hypothetical protein C8F01DRAFT_502492 [Mycena amicta]